MKKKTCLRCGNSYNRLDIHIKKKTICEATFLDIPYDNMIEEYDKHYDTYVKVVSSILNTKICNNCGKKYRHRSSLSRHKKLCNLKNYSLLDTNVIQPHQPHQPHQPFQQFQPLHISVGDVHLNIDNKKIYNISLQNFGNEILPDIMSLIEQLEDVMTDTTKQIEGEDIFNIALKVLYIDTEQNRNLIIKNANDGRIDVRENNNWITKSRKSMKNKVIENTKKYINHFLGLADSRVKDADTKYIIKRIRQFYNEYIGSQEYNEQVLYSILINHLISNKYLLTEFQNKTKKLETKELSNDEKTMLKNKIINDFEKKSKYKMVKKIKQNEEEKQIKELDNNIVNDEESDEESDEEGSYEDDGEDIESIDSSEQFNNLMNIIKAHGKKVIIN